jgi:hypothetical protein
MITVNDDVFSLQRLANSFLFPSEDLETNPIPTSGVISSGSWFIYLLELDRASP